MKAVHTWTSTTTAIQKAGINIRETRTSGENIRIMPRTPNDYKLLVRLLDQLKLEFFSYHLANERPMLVVIKGLPRNTSSEEIKLELSSQGFPVISAKWMTYTRAYAVVSLERRDEGKAIYSLRECFGLAIKVETKHSNKGAVQCTNSQDFGHSRAPVS